MHGVSFNDSVVVVRQMFVISEQVWCTGYSVSEAAATTQHCCTVVAEPHGHGHGIWWLGESHDHARAAGLWYGEHEQLFPTPVSCLGSAVLTGRCILRRDRGHVTDRGTFGAWTSGLRVSGVAERSKLGVVRTRTYDIANLHPLSSRPFCQH